MINFFYGILFMYIFAWPLLFYIAEPTDEQDTTAPLRFALMWPLASLEVLVRMLLQGDQD